MRAAARSALLLAAAAPAPAAADGRARAELLQTQLQALLTHAAAQEPGTQWQLGWKSASLEFSVAAGSVTPPGGGAPRAVTPADTFLYGSPSKTYTASMVMLLAERGLLSLDDPLQQHVDPVLARMNGTSLAQLFGAVNASKMTVGHVLQMRAGVRDYDFGPGVRGFDQSILLAGDTRHLPVEFIREGVQAGPLYCVPGECVRYSSTSYVLAGLVLVRHIPQWPADWALLNETAILPPAVAASIPRTHFFQDERLDKWLTVPSTFRTPQAHSPRSTTTVFSQSSTVLGWTCSNLVAPAAEVARFFWDLLGPTPRVVSAQSVESMSTMRDAGWVKYGTGLMLSSINQPMGYGPNPGGEPPQKGAWGSFMGHVGEVYGYQSNQGYFYGLNASISIVSTGNPDTVLCNAVKTAASVLHGKQLNVTCTAPRQPSAACVEKLFSGCALAKTNLTRCKHCEQTHAAQLAAANCSNATLDAFCMW